MLADYPLKGSTTWRRSQKGNGRGQPGTMHVRLLGVCSVDVFGLLKVLMVRNIDIIEPSFKLHDNNVDIHNTTTAL